MARGWSFLKSLKTSPPYVMLHSLCKSPQAHVLLAQAEESCWLCCPCSLAGLGSHCWPFCSAGTGGWVLLAARGACTALGLCGMMPLPWPRGECWLSWRKTRGFPWFPPDGCGLGHVGASESCRKVCSASHRVKKRGRNLWVLRKGCHPSSRGDP